MIKALASDTPLVSVVLSKAKLSSGANIVSNVPIQYQGTITWRLGRINDNNFAKKGIKIDESTNRGEVQGYKLHSQS